MQTSRTTFWLSRLVAYTVLAYGGAIIADALMRQLRVHHGHALDLLLITVPQVTGLGFMYLGTLLLRRKYNAWLVTIVLACISLVLDVWHASLHSHMHVDDPGLWVRPLITLCLIGILWVTREAFRVKSDARTFTQALWVSVLVLLVAFLYGMGGFALLDDRDFHHEVSTTTAAHLTIDQLGLTDNHPVAYTRRARLFLDSLSVITIAAIGYAAISFFEPIRVALTSQTVQRAKAFRLLERYPSDLDDYYKLWPHNKLYYFDETGEAGLAYHVTRGVALVVGNPFGNAVHFDSLIDSFLELCFVNDWLPGFIHVSAERRKLFERYNLRLQKIGEEGVLDLLAFDEVRRDKYFRQIRNKFTKLGYHVEIHKAPHDSALMDRLREISDEWLKRPGRAERGFMLGYFDQEYFDRCNLAVLYDADNTIQGFMNFVPTFENDTSNYDLLRCAGDAPGNANDFLMMGALEYARSNGVTTFNLGLSPLSGVDVPDTEEKTLIDQALRFVYANGDRFYSFSGLKRFKAKYKPVWTSRYIVYPGGVRNFTRILTALNRTMKVR